jgi:transcriptional regulator with XRE-family HTH domain
VTPLIDDSLKEAFGDAVRKSRLSAGLSQEKLAELADIHRTYIGDVERGLRNIALVNMYRISAALGVPLSSIIRDMEKSIDASGTI